MKRNKGFSLVELMVVVGIMGILASIAIPRFQTYQAKAKRTEAQSLLGQIFTLMTVNYNDYGTYSYNHNSQITATKVDTAGKQSYYGRLTSTTANCNFADITATGNWAGKIGFSVSPCNSGNQKEMPFYAYWIYSIADTTFLAIAQAPEGVVNKCDTAGMTDELSIDQEKVIKIRMDGVNCVKGTETAKLTQGAVSG